MKVRIKTWEEMEKEFGLDEHGNIPCYCYFVPEMKQFCGNVIEVEGYEDYFVCDKEYNLWEISDDMIKEVIER